MKNFFRFLLLSLFLATSFSAASCSDDDDNPATPDNSIIGTWTLDDNEEESLTIQFNKNGTGSLDYQSAWEDETQRFEYNYQPEEYYLRIINSVLEGSYDVSVTKSILILEGYSGEFSGTTMKFTRK